MDAQQQLFGLMTLAEEHQKAVKAAIDGLTTERQALAKDRAMLIQAAASITKTAAEAIPAIQKATGAAVDDAVRDSLAGASNAAVKALNEACRPVIDRLAGVVRVSGEAEAQLNTASQWFAWKWVALAFFGLAGVCLVAWASVWWQMHQVEQLTAEVAELKAGAEDLAKRGGRAEISNCGDKKRLCVRVEKKEVFGKDGDFLILKGY
jgi:hypothetical protein